ncbi:MAG: addiction module toxin, HicA family [Acidobacteria bacterium]|nr:addiction module toxin, HicA family [Acidobacteriota bacterium]
MPFPLPALTPKQVIRALKKAGFFVHHQRGSHAILKHPQRPQRVTVTVHNRDLKRRTLSSIIKQSGLTRDEFVKRL